MKNLARVYLILLLLANSEFIYADTYQNELTGEIHFEEWGKPDNGLQCRVGTSKLIYQFDKDTPIIVLEVKNISPNAIAINDLFNPEMLLEIKPCMFTYYGSDFKWIFDSERLKTPLNSGEVIRAVCRIPAELLPYSKYYDKSFTIEYEISRSKYPSKILHGVAPRNPNWWTGSIRTNILKYNKK